MAAPALRWFPSATYALGSAARSARSTEISSPSVTSQTLCQVARSSSTAKSHGRLSAYCSNASANAPVASSTALFTVPTMAEVRSMSSARPRAFSSSTLSLRMMGPAGVFAVRISSVRAIPPSPIWRTPGLEGPIISTTQRSPSTVRVRSPAVRATMFAAALVRAASEPSGSSPAGVVMSAWAMVTRRIESVLAWM